MNEKLKYAEMLDIPVNSCNITYKPIKKRKRKIQLNSDVVKDKVIEKVNNEEQNTEVDVVTSDSTTITPKKKRKFSIVGFEVAIICCLIFTIFLTSAILPNSGLTNFFSSTFKEKQIENVDNRLYSDFTPVFSVSKSDVESENGIMTLKNQNSVYAPCDGKIESITKGEDGLFSMVVKHSENFSTVIGGLKYAYGNVGDKVFKTIPVAYADNDITVCFVDGLNNVITDSVVGSSSVWAEKD